MAKKILCLENLPYKANIKIGSHHYADIFSETCDVFWLSLPFHLLQLLKDRKSDRVKNWHFNRPVSYHDRLQAFTPIVALPYRNNVVLKSDVYLKNYCRFFPFLKSFLRKGGFDQPDLAWFTDPRHISILKYVKPKKIVYRCVDNLEYFDDIPKSLIASEERLIKLSDVVFYTSHDLKKKFEGLNANSYYLPNGCDYEYFSSPEIAD